MEPAQALVEAAGAHTLEEAAELGFVTFADTAHGNGSEVRGQKEVESRRSRVEGPGRGEGGKLQIPNPKLQKEVESRRSRVESRAPRHVERGKASLTGCSCSNLTAKERKPRELGMWTEDKSGGIRAQSKRFANY